MKSLRIVAFSILTWAAAEAAPGIVNFAEGKVTLDGQPLGEGAAVQMGQTLQIEQGRAELLLTPGAYLRAGADSAIKMDAVSATLVKVELVRGEAVLEVDQVDKAHRLEILQGAADAYVDHPGVFRFTAAQPAVAVFRGRIRVEDDRRGTEIGAGEELLLNGGGNKPRKFDQSEPGSLYVWTLERAAFAAQLCEWTGEGLLGLDGRSKYTEGWYWNPWYKSWAFLPERAYLRTPLGFGLYAPQTPHYRMPSFADFRN